MKSKLYLRRFRSANGVGLILFRPDRPNSGPYFVLSLRPRQRRVLLRVLRHVVGLSWWPPRFLNAAALWAERRANSTADADAVAAMRSLENAPSMHLGSPKRPQVM